MPFCKELYLLLLYKIWCDPSFLLNKQIFPTLYWLPTVLGRGKPEMGFLHISSRFWWWAITTDRRNFLCLRRYTGTLQWENAAKGAKRMVVDFFLGRPRTSSLLTWAKVGIWLALEKDWPQFLIGQSEKLKTYRWFIHTLSVLFKLDACFDTHSCALFVA
jgi:hypothetical protein